MPLLHSITPYTLYHTIHTLLHTVYHTHGISYHSYSTLSHSILTPTLYHSYSACACSSSLYTPLFYTLSSFLYFSLSLLLLSVHYYTLHYNIKYKINKLPCFILTLLYSYTPGLFALFTPSHTIHTPSHTLFTLHHTLYSHSTPLIELSLTHSVCSVSRALSAHSLTLSYLSHSLTSPCSHHVSCTLSVLLLFFLFSPHSVLYYTIHCT